MFWSIMHKAFDNWPDEHPAKPNSVEHLVGWLLIEVGASTHADVETDDKEAALAIARAIFKITQRRIHCMRVFPLKPVGLRICVPDSLAYENAGKRKYEAVRSAVYEIVEMVLGTTIEQLKQVAQRGST